MFQSPHPTQPHTHTRLYHLPLTNSLEGVVLLCEGPSWPGTPHTVQADL